MASKERSSSEPGSIFRSSTVEVLVGVDTNSRQSFYVHEAKLCSTSEFFQNAMKPEWAQAKSNPRSVELLDTTPRTFGIYLDWLYSRKLPKKDADLEGEQVYEKYAELAEVYVLGEAIMDSAFQDALVDEISALPKHYYVYPGVKAIAIIYKGTPVYSPLRRLLVDFWVSRAHAGNKTWLIMVDKLPTDFLIDTIKGMIKLRKPWAKEPWVEDNSQYKVSENDEEEGIKHD